MTDDLRAPIEPRTKRLDGPASPLTAGALTASVLFDVLSLVADGPAQVTGYERGAADILTLGLSGSLVSTALEVVEYLRAPATSIDANASRRFALNGALIAVYLLNVAARRQRNLGDPTLRSISDALPTGLSLLGLTLIGLTGKQ